MTRQCEPWKLMRFLNGCNVGWLFRSWESPANFCPAVTSSITRDGYPIRILAVRNALHRTRVRLFSFPENNSRNIWQQMRNIPVRSSNDNASSVTPAPCFYMHMREAASGYSPTYTHGSDRNLVETCVKPRVWEVSGDEGTLKGIG